TALLTAGIGYQAGFRSFSYNDPLSSNLRPYHVSAVPGIALHAELFPAASSDSALRDLGITGRFARAFNLESASSDDQKVNTKWQSWAIGLRYRIKTGPLDKAPLVGVLANYES